MGLELARAFVTILADTSQVGPGIKRAKPKVQAATSELAAAASVAMKGALTAATVAAVVGGFTKMVRSGEEFNRKMRSSTAIMGDLSRAMSIQLRDASFKAARATQFSSAQAAESLFFLASAGLSAEQSIAAMPQVAQFAQAGMFDMATATDLATDAQSALGLTVKDAEQNLTNLTRVTDVLVGANTLANASVRQFAEAITNKAGTAARTVKKDIEELTAVLAVFADKGIKSAAAGNAINIVFRELQSRALQNATAFKHFNITVFDSEDRMRNMADIVEDLEKALSGMEAAQIKATLAQLGFMDRSQIFIQALIGSSAKIRELEERLREMERITKRVAAAQLTEWQKFTAEFEVLGAKVGSSFMRMWGPGITNATEGLGILSDTLGDASLGFAEMSDVLMDVLRIQTNFAGRNKEITKSLLEVMNVTRKVILPVYELGDAFQGLGVTKEEVEAFRKEVEKLAEELGVHLREGPVYRDIADEADKLFSLLRRSRTIDVFHYDEDFEPLIRRFSSIQDAFIAIRNAQEAAITPMEKYKQLIQDIANFERIGALTAAQAMRERKKAAEALAEVTGEAGKRREVEQERKRAIEDRKRGLEDLVERGRRITESLRTPVEESFARISELRDLFAKGVLGREAFRRGLVVERGRLEKGLRLEQAVTGRVGFADFGKQIQDAVLKRDDPQKGILKATEGAEKLLRDISKYLKNLRNVGMLK